MGGILLAFLWEVKVALDTSIIWHRVVSASLLKDAIPTEALQVEVMVDIKIVVDEKV